MSNLNWAASWLKTVGYVTVGYLAVSAGMGCGKNPRDLRMAPQDLLHSLMTGHAGRNPAPAAMSSPAIAAAYDGYCRPEQGDMATVHGSRRAVAQTYGRYIPRDTSCVSPAIEFDDQLANAKGAPTAGMYYRRFHDLPGTDTLLFKTSIPHLPKVAAHEWLHCYTHENFIALWNRGLERHPGLFSALWEGATEYFARRTPVKKLEPAGSDDVYHDEVKLVERIIAEIGENTLKQAFFSGDPEALNSVLCSTMRNAGHVKTST